MRKLVKDLNGLSSTILRFYDFSTIYRLSLTAKGPALPFSPFSLFSPFPPTLD